MPLKGLVRISLTQVSSDIHVCQVGPVFIVEAARRSWLQVQYMPQKRGPHVFELAPLYPGPLSRFASLHSNNSR